MKPRTWAAVVGSALTIMIGGALVIAEDHEPTTTTTVPVVIETTTTAAVETTPTTAPPAYGIEWHTGYPDGRWDQPGATEEHRRQESIAVANGLLYHARSDGAIQVYPIDLVNHFTYYNPYPGKEWGSIYIYTQMAAGVVGRVAVHISLLNVSDLAGLVAELEDALGD